jgi:hypothetical protein
MSCSEKNELVVWNLKGEQLAKVDTYLMTTVCAHISPCARFVVASGRFLESLPNGKNCYCSSGTVEGNFKLDFFLLSQVFSVLGNISQYSSTAVAACGASLW